METRLLCGDPWEAEKLGAFWRWPITRCFIESHRAGLIIQHSINFHLNSEHWRAVQCWILDIITYLCCLKYLNRHLIPMSINCVTTSLQSMLYMTTRYPNWAHRLVKYSLYRIGLYIFTFSSSCTHSDDYIPNFMPKSSIISMNYHSIIVSYKSSWKQIRYCHKKSSTQSYHLNYLGNSRVPNAAYQVSRQLVNWFWEDI